MPAMAPFAIALLVFFPAPPEAVWVWPTTGPPVVIRDFEAPQTPWGPGHRGLDLPADSLQVLAPASGRVSFEGQVGGRGVITITTGQGWQISMEPVESGLTPGEWVGAGDDIGQLQPGHCAELCLHLGLRIKGEYRSPAQELGLLRRAVLLPWSP